MPETLDFESDAFLTLLTDALRAGPGSPEWHEAVARVRAEGGAEGAADEHRLLLTAREHLASGRSYREVRPGPGFDRKVLTAIDEEAARGPRRSVPTASLIAVLSAVAVLVLLVGGGYALWQNARELNPPDQDLGRVYFTQELTSLELRDRPGSGWRTFGPLPLAFDWRGMRPDRDDAPDGDGFVGGGILWEQPMPPGRPISAEVTLRLPDEIDPDTIVQVFVTDTPDPSGDRGTTQHELVWMLRGRQAEVVLPSGRVVGDGATLGRGWAEVKIMLNRTQAVIAADGERLYSGEHGLDPNQPRYLGVRLLSRADADDADDGSDERQPARVRSIRIQAPRE